MKPQELAQISTSEENMDSDFLTLALLVCKTESPTLPDFLKLLYIEQTCRFNILFLLCSVQRKHIFVSSSNVWRRNVSEFFLNMAAYLKTTD